MLNVLIVYAVSEEKVNLQMPNCRFHYCITGVGKVNAAIAVEHAIAAYHPDLVINIGTAGSVVHQIGTIHLCNQFVDRDMEKLAAFHVPFKEDFSLELKKLGCFKGWKFESICNTGDHFLTGPDGSGDVFDMESFAIARVCRSHQIPFAGIKYITDKIGENSVRHWEEKLSDARHALQTYMDSNHLVVPENWYGRNVQYLIKTMKLQLHPEGGWFRETYRSSMTLCCEGLPRSFTSDKSAITSIHYLLANEHFSAFHRIKSPEIWYFHKGTPLILHLIHPKGRYQQVELSGNEDGLLQYTVEEGCWFAAELKDQYGYALVSCAVAPGFDYEDFEMARKSELVNKYPKLSPIIIRLSKD